MKCCKYWGVAVCVWEMEAEKNRADALVHYCFILRCLSQLQNHRMGWFGRGHWRSWSSTPCHGQGQSPQRTSLWRSSVPAAAQFLCLWAWCASELFVTHLGFKIDVAERNRWLRFQCKCQVLLGSFSCWACRDGFLRAGAWLCSAATPLSHGEQRHESAFPEKSSHVSV